MDERFPESANSAVDGTHKSIQTDLGRLKQQVERLEAVMGSEMNNRARLEDIVLSKMRDPVASPLSHRVVQPHTHDGRSRSNLAGGKLSRHLRVGSVPNLDEVDVAYNISLRQQERH